MPRRKSFRKIVAPPKFLGYKPYGLKEEQKGSVELPYEEYEAIKLADYDMLNHKEACELMGVSRATFARIYESARKNIAKALVEAKEIKTVFGNAIFVDNWFLCNECHAKFTIPDTMLSNACPFCKSSSIENLIPEKGDT